tara:strand:- start:474 stop:2303 length:1830 start_codon:yes stop_codon:yes gene_type:complete
MSRTDAAVNAAFQKLLGRDAGTEGKTYWGNQWEEIYNNAKNNQGMSDADAQAAATASIESGIGGSTEALNYQVDTAFGDQLGRESGVEGQTYWGNQWKEAYAAAKGEGMSNDEARTAALENIKHGISGSAEAKTFARTNIAKAKTLDDAGVAGYYRGGARDEEADWYETNFTEDDPNEYGTGMRDADWANKLSTSNLENYLDTLNYQYGVLQGNTVGQEGSEWWGYQKTQGINYYMSEEGGDYSFETASKLADFDIARDIKQSTGAKNFERYGSIGYGNPLSIKTNKEANVEGTAGDSEFGIENVYLNFNEKAMKELREKFGTAEGEDLVTTGTITGDQGNKTSAFTYKADASAPGGFRITGNTDVAKVISGELSGTGSEGTVVDQGYLNDRGLPTFKIPDTVTNVDASRFTLPANTLNADNTINYGDASDPSTKLSLSKWTDTESGKAAVEADDYSYKNLNMNVFTDVDGKEYLVAGATKKTGGDDTNLGLKDNETLAITDGGTGETTTLTGGTITNVTNVTNAGDTINEGDNIEGDESNISNYYYGSGGGGKTIVNTAVPQKSKTAKQQQKKEDPRVLASAPNRKQYQKIKSTPGVTGNVAQLGIVT